MHRFILFVPLFVAISTRAFAAEITITSSSIYVSTSQADRFTGTAIPTHTTLQKFGDDLHNITKIDWYQSAGLTILSHDFDHQRSGIYRDFDETTISSILFTANSNEPYKLSGFYNVTDVGAPGTTVFAVKLVDQTTGRNQYNFVNSELSQTDPNPHFTLPGNLFTGNLTGNLIAGHTYLFGGASLIFCSNPNGDLGASALGNITLTIGPAVPEPASIELLLICLGFLVNRRRPKAFFIENKYSARWRNG